MAAAPLIIAHRGASWDAPENTLAAFRLAWEQNADGIESDYYLTKDGSIVCLHDDHTGRLSRTDLKVADSTLSELRQLDIGQWKNARWVGEKIPTLDEVLAIVPPGKRLFAEIKCGPEIVPAFQRAVQKSAVRPEQITVLSFNAEVIAAVKRQLRSLQALWLVSYRKTGDAWDPSPEQVLKTLREIRADGLSSQASDALDAAFAETLKKARQELHVWTVDSPQIAERFCQLGVRSITTNRPAYLRENLPTACR